MPPKPSLACPNSWCSKVFDRKSNLERHVKDSCKQKEKKTFVCSHAGCTAKFQKMSKLRRHAIKHQPKNTFTCTTCSKVYLRKDHYAEHLLKHQPETEDEEVMSEDEQDEQQFYVEPVFLGDVAEPYPGDDIQPSASATNFTAIHDDTLLAQDFESLHASSFQEDPHRVYVIDHDDTLDINNVSLYSTLEFDSELASCTMKHLRLLKHQGKRSSVKLQEFAKLCTLLFSKKINDDFFMERLALDLGFINKNELIDFMNTTPSTSKRGRPMSGQVERQLMYDFWVEHSDPSNDRRNARHVVKIKPSKRDVVSVDLVDPDVESFQVKGVTKLKAQRRVYSRTVRELYSEFCKAHSDVTCSSTLFYRCKPFYIGPATDREMEGCLCAKCLNPHALYTTLKRYIKNLPLSLTDYLTTFFECSKDRDLNFYKLACIEGSCKDGCRIINESKKKICKWTKCVSYYQFEPKLESFYNRSGILSWYQRTARVDYHDKTLGDAYALLMSCAREYLRHRYYTILDKVFWQKYLAGTTSPVIWMDYSVNIKLVEKNQAQSANYSGRQQTLHDSLIQLPNKQFRYVYHLSDDTNHDSVMTEQVIAGIIESHPEVIAPGRLLLRSDNCSTQYKSRFVFKSLLNFSCRHNIRIDFFYGEAGHGRGLVDAMAWFGCKGPLRKSILTEDSWYSNAGEMVEYLSKRFEDDDSKEYHLIDEKSTAELRKAGREERAVPGCKAAHVISFFPDGQSVHTWKTIKEFLETSDEVTSAVVEDVEDVDDEETLQEITYVETIEHEDRFHLIELNSFVAIRPIAKSFEQFHLYKVVNKLRATQHMHDVSGEHSILKDEPYIVGQWYSFQTENRKFAQYAEARNTELAQIHMGEIISTNVEVDERNRVDIFEYRMLKCSM